MATLSGGAKLAAKLLELAKVADNPATLRVGFLDNAKYPDGTPVAMIAAIQEFGAPGARWPIPPRPFFRNMIAKHRNEWAPAIMRLLRDNNWDAAKALAIAGDAIAGQLRQSITDTMAPPLSPVTIMVRSIKGSKRATLKMVYEAIARVQGGKKPGKGYEPGSTGAKPLVDSGHLLGSVDWEIV